VFREWHDARRWIDDELKKQDQPASDRSQASDTAS
jgi:hypothetical protein